MIPMLRLRLVGVVLVALALAPTGADAQRRWIIDGTVQWTSSNRIQVMSDSAETISVDVSRIDQSAYSGLRGGERVRVIGYVPPERNRLIAESFVITDSWPYWSPTIQTP